MGKIVLARVHVANRCVTKKKFKIDSLEREMDEI